MKSHTTVTLYIQVCPGMRDWFEATLFDLGTNWYVDAPRFASPVKRTAVTRCKQWAARNGYAIDEVYDSFKHRTQP